MTASPLPLVGAPTRPLPAGSPPGYDAFVLRHRLRLRRHVERRLRDPGEAEEITQETLLRAHAHWHELPDEDAAAAWTTVVATRLVLDRLRVSGRSVPVPEFAEGAVVTRDTADIVVARAEARSALEALEALPARQAGVVWAREVEGLSYDEIGQRHGLTEPAVRSLLSRGRKALRREYALRGGELPLGAVVPLAPALQALRMLGRLRRSLVTGGAATAAGLGLVVAAVLGGALPGPAGALPAMPASTPVLQRVAPAVPTAVPAPAPPVRRAPVAVPPVVPAARPVATRAAALPVLPDTCASGRRTAVGVCLTGDVDDTAGVTLSVPLAGDRARVQTDLVTHCPPVPTPVCTGRPADSGTPLPVTP